MTTELFVGDDDLLDLAAYFGAGHFTGAELYARYVQVSAEAGRAPAAKTALNRALREAGWAASFRTIYGDQFRCWEITESWHAVGNRRRSQLDAGAQTPPRPVG